MKSNQEKLKNIFEKYGKITSLGMDSEKDKYYKFACNIKSLYDEESIFYSLSDKNFALVCRENGEGILYYFRVGINDVQDENIYRILNQVNKKVEYGKYTLDSDGEIDWEYRFDILYIDSKDIKEALLSFYESVILFVLLKKDPQFLHKENLLYEKGTI